MKENYQKMLDEKLAALAAEGRSPHLLLHSCCGPCSTYVLQYLADHFTIDLYYYNPNIAPAEEFYKRLDAQRRVLECAGLKDKVKLIVPPYHPEEFTEIAKGLEQEPERGKRCERCIELRIRESARYAAEHGYDCFCTTLSVSPHKDAELLYALSEKYARLYKIDFLPADFKKKNGFLTSILLSKEYGIYRQSYCGCLYAK